MAAFLTSGHPMVATLIVSQWSACCLSLGLTGIVHSLPLSPPLSLLCSCRFLIPQFDVLHDLRACLGENLEELVAREVIKAQGGKAEEGSSDAATTAEWMGLNELKVEMKRRCAATCLASF